MHKKEEKKKMNSYFPLLEGRGGVARSNRLQGNNIQFNESWGYNAQPNKLVWQNVAAVLDLPYKVSGKNNKTNNVLQVTNGNRLIQVTEIKEIKYGSNKYTPNTVNVS